MFVLFSCSKPLLSTSEYGLFLKLMGIVGLVLAPRGIKKDENQRPTLIAENTITTLAVQLLSTAFFFVVYFEGMTQTVKEEDFVTSCFSTRNLLEETDVESVTE